MPKFSLEKLSVNNSIDCTHIQSVRNFDVIKMEHFNRQIINPSLKPLKGLCDIHSLQIVTDKVHVLKVRPLSCFCQVCLIGKASQCLIKILPWIVKTFLLAVHVKKKNEQKTPENKGQNQRNSDCTSPSGGLKGENSR